MKYTQIVRLVVRYPFAFLALTFLLSLTPAVILGKYDLYSMTEATDRDYFVENDIRTELYDAVNMADSALSTLNSTSLQPQSVPTQSMSIFVLYESLGEDLFSIENVRRMKETEDLILNAENYASLCSIDYAESTECSSGSYASFLTHLGEVDYANSSDLSSAIEAAREALSPALQNLYLDKNAVNSEVTYVRTIFTYALPFPGFSSPSDRLEEQLLIYDDFINEFLSDITEMSTDTMNVFVTGERLLNILTLSLANADLLWASGSIFFVFLYLTFHLNSLFLGVMSIIQILLAFPMAYCVYRYVFGIEFFQTLHTLTIFLLLGVGADDFAVFYDSWRQSKHLVDEQKRFEEKRMVYAWKRASKAMFVTTCSTIGAFAATALSPITPIASFGVFAAVLLACNYLLVVTLFPASIAVAMRLPCRREKSTPHAARESITDNISPSAGKTHREKILSGEYAGDEYRRVERFFANIFAPSVFRLRYGILAVFFAWFLVSTVYGVGIRPVSEQEKWYPDDHFISQSLDILTTQFYQSASDLGVILSLVWGVSGIDRSGTSKWDVSDYGVAVFDPEFSVSPAGQQYLLQVCEDAKVWEDVLIDTTGTPGVTCFIEGFRDYLEAGNRAFPTASFSSDLKEWALTTPEGRSHLDAMDFGWDSNGDLRMLKMHVSITVRPFASEEELQTAYDTWENRVSTMNSEAPAGVSKMIQTANGVWCFMTTKRAFVTSALTGMGIAIIMAFLVLNVSTRNWLVSCVSTVCILGILSSVVACMVLVGYELGTAESISMVILIGFCLDYVVHLGNHYVEDKEDDRVVRMTNALRDMGVSIVAGGVTTIGSAAFLWGAIVIFFTKFAFIMTTTILFSWLWGLVFFSAAMFVCGPEKNSGRVC